MKYLTMTAAATGLLIFASCAHPLEQVVDQRHQARIDASNANHPLAQGAADGLGGYIAHSRDAELEAGIKVSNP